MDNLLSNEKHLGQRFHCTVQKKNHKIYGIFSSEKILLCAAFVVFYFIPFPLVPAEGREEPASDRTRPPEKFSRQFFASILAAQRPKR